MVQITNMNPQVENGLNMLADEMKRIGNVKELKRPLWDEIADYIRANLEPRKDKKGIMARDVALHILEMVDQERLKIKYENKKS